ncbi:carboxymuconolactone decarboxylase family protein [Brevibacterium spongiae]|uniref:Carboxymuconolactone decarboxylase family protein n=1 Tax=Brevibacterium spongiae TaxID=2909672 RepID=A0ABY5SPU1_9MICO|nr:carboxymuconolactone decarboxylase family protein [Brevibacterium spongiae]UVI36502.1 carboxymuconolactone decarboxylase family protein [Brevibacterium spongiae]
MTRISLDQINQKAYSSVAHMDSYCRRALGTELYDFVKLRASIVNGCGFCVDMHSSDLLAHGISSRKVLNVAAWQHAGAIFDDRERSVFALTDAVTKIGPDSVTDEIWEAAASHFAPEELGDLLLGIATINVWNRLAISTETTPPAETTPLAESDAAAAPAPGDRS